MDVLREVDDARLKLIPQIRDHAREMHGLLNDPALYAYTGGGPPDSLEWLVNRFRLLESRRSPDGKQLWLNWVIREKASGRLVGYVQATVDGSTADAAWVIGTAHQGRGHATRAARLMLGELERMGVRQLTCHVNRQHTASIRVAEKLGFADTGSIEDGEAVFSQRLSTGHSTSRT